jgi:hypothetical protein
MVFFVDKSAACHQILELIRHRVSVRTRGGLRENTGGRLAKRAEMINRLDDSLCDCAER